VRNFKIQHTSAILPMEQLPNFDSNLNTKWNGGDNECGSGLLGVRS